MDITNSPIEFLSDCALRIRFARKIHTELPTLIQSVCQQLEYALGENLTDLIPSYTNLLVIFNPQGLDLATAQQKIRHALIQAQQQVSEHSPIRTHQIPVYYSEETGIDLGQLSQTKNLTVDQIIDLHSQITYQVYAIGFSPAFAYLAEIPEQLAMPRLATPRLRVPAGSVAIADRQTAIYPIASPAGWHVLGRTPLDLSLNNPQNLMRFKVGDQVQFEPISQSIFQNLQQENGTF